MTEASTVVAYEDWLAELRRLAAARDLAWMIARDAQAHRGAFDAGLSADDELNALADMAEWRGCGCVGS